MAELWRHTSEGERPQWVPVNPGGLRPGDVVCSTYDLARGMGTGVYNVGIMPTRCEPSGHLNITHAALAIIKEKPHATSSSQAAELKKDS